MLVRKSERQGTPWDILTCVVGWYKKGSEEMRDWGDSSSSG
jgi:hypothetical protein